MNTLQVVQGSIGGRVTTQITSGGLPLELSNFSVFMRFRNVNSTTALWERECVKLTPYDDGYVEYTWQTNDLDVPGIYNIEVEVRSDDNLVNVTSPEVIVVEVLQRMTLSGD
jgi:hypothetical protein